MQPRQPNAGMPGDRGQAQGSGRTARWHRECIPVLLCRDTYSCMISRGLNVPPNLVFFTHPKMPKGPGPLLAAKASAVDLELHGT